MSLPTAMPRCTAGRSPRLVYAGARYYSPTLGRFVSPDMLSILQPDELVGPLHLNPYVYAGNNPLRLVDDNGLFWKWIVGGLIIAALIVATIATAGVGGFAFGILLAASIGSGLGWGVGVISVYASGGDLADGFLFGATVGGAGGAAKVKRWLMRDPRFQYHFTPTYSSWLNLVERFFARLTEQQLRRGTHRSVPALEKAIRAYLETYNEDPKPFRWTKSADEMIESAGPWTRRFREGTRRGMPVGAPGDT